MPHPTAIHRHVDEARVGGTRVLARLTSGWAVMGESQLLPGYGLLLPDPVVPSLNDLAPTDRAAYLNDMALLGDAVTEVCTAPNSSCPPRQGFRRINYEILGNLEPALHAHVIPRFENEPEAYRTKAVWMYPPEMWNAPEHRYDAKNPAHAALRERLAHAIEKLRQQPLHQSRTAEADFSGTAAATGSLFERACAFAARAHAGHFRKDNITPYVTHPYRVALLVRDRFGVFDPVALAAAVLHDTLEDTRTDHDDLSERFGTEVADIVAALSKDKRLPEPIRERAYDTQLAASDWRARLIKLCDVLDNADDTCRAAPHVRPSPDTVRERFRRAVEIARPLAGKHAALGRAIEAVEARTRATV
ncbi:MAG: HD domain-containing protein [Phycisphaerales bacterium]